MMNYELLMLIRDELTIEASDLITDDNLEIIIKVAEQFLNPWKSIKKDGLPEEGQWYDAYTYVANGERIVRELFYDGQDDYGEHYWLADGDWKGNVTHWRERPTCPTILED